MEGQVAKTEQIQITDNIPLKVETIDIRSQIHIVRGKQVMLDSDLAMLYKVETGALNRAVKRNKKRFPEDFCFQLSEEEFLRCQNGISKDDDPDGRGGRRYMPYAFTEQGISMLSAILRSDIAINVSIGIMRAFVEMRKFLATNSLILNRVEELEVKQLEYQKSTDERFDRVFQYIEDHAESEQKIFFEGQIYDAFSLITTIIQKAKSDIILIDGYVDVNTLNILAKKNAGVDVTIFTYASAPLTKKDVENFNAQYPTLTVKKTQVFHDRFIMLDGKTVYHIGASIKDAGKKCFGISLINDSSIVLDILNRLKTI
jgi:hypothetical protein